MSIHFTNNKKDKQLRMRLQTHIEIQNIAL